MSTTKRTDSPIVSPSELAELISVRAPAVLDATWVMPGDSRDAAAMFVEKRIAGAQRFDIDLISDRSSALPHMLPSPEVFEAALRALGLREGQMIIVYDNVGMMSAPRAWWSLRAMGLTNVRVLDGGLAAWIAADLPVESGVPHAPSPGDITVRPIAELVATRLEVEALLADDHAVVIDARPGPRFRGEQGEPRPGLRSGHMPGARNAPWTLLVDADGRLKCDAELQAALGDVEAAKTIVCTCGSGVTACVAALALALLGRDDARVYDGSWAEWGLPDGPPIKTGA